MIQIQNISKSFKLLEALSNVSFSCQSGRICTLLGTNGAGKTTLLRMIATLIKPTSGMIRVQGIDVAKNPQEIQKNIGFLTASMGLYNRLTPNEMVKYFADLHKLDQFFYQKQRHEIFDKLNILDFAERPIAKLSTGMKKRVSLALSIIHDPEVLIFDEPTNGLDIIASQEFIGFIKKEAKDRGKTIIYSTHIMVEAALISDDLAILHHGKLLYHGTYQEFDKQKQLKSLEDEFVKMIEENQ